MRFLLLIAALAAASSANAQTCTTSWTNPAGGAWTTAANWSAGVPTGTSDACITLAGTYTVTVAGFAVNSLTLGGASGAQTLVQTGAFSFAAAGSVTANGVYEWRDGYLTAGTLTNAGLVRLAGGGGSRGLSGSGVLFRNEATVTWTDASPFYLFNSFTLPTRVENAGLWDVQNVGDVLGFGGTAGGSDFVNEAAGTFQRSTSASADVTRMVVTRFTNAGTVQALAGSVQVESASTHTDATLTAALGATVLLSGTPTFVGTISGAPAGTVRLAANFTAGAGAAWAFTGTGLEWADGYLTAGTLTNAGLVRLAGGGGSRGLSGSGVLFRNEATVTWTDASPFYLFNSFTLPTRVENAGLWDVQNVGDVLGFGGTAGGSDFVNEAAGTFQRSTSASADVTRMVVTRFTNAGTVQALAGSVQVESASTHTDATLTAALGATVLLSGTPTFVGTISGAPAGTVRLAANFTAGAGAAWAFTGTGLEWQDGYLTAGTMVNAALVRLNGSGGNRGVNTNGAVFRNEATVTWTDASPFYLYNNGSRAENAGLWDTQNVGDVLGFGGVSGSGSTFVNEATGTFQRTVNATADATRFTVNLLANAGTVQALAGTVQVESASTHTDATLTAAAGATVLLTSGTATFVGTVGGAPAGTVRLAANFTAGAGAAWAFTGTGLEWQDGYLTAGTMVNAALVRLNGSGGNRGVNTNGAVFRNEATVTWTDASPFYLYNNGSRAENAGLWDTQNVGDVLGFGGVSDGGSVFVNEAAGTFQRTVSASADATRFAVNQVTNAGIFRPVTGTIDVDSPFNHQAGARIEGTGTFDKSGSTPFTHAGDTAPGTPTATGTLTWTGTYQPIATSTLRIDLGGPTAGTDYDRLAATGAATLAGALDLSVLPAFAPTTGQAFTVLTATSVSGTFSSVTGSPGFAFSVAYTATSVVVTVTAVGVTTTLTSPTANAADGRGYRMLAPAVQGQTYDGLIGGFFTQGFPGSDYPPAPQANAYTYDETATGDQNNGYLPLANQTDPVALGTGFFVLVYEDDDFNGPMPAAFPKTITQSGTDVMGPFAFPGLTYTASATANDDGWNIAGNPFAASMDWDVPGWTKTNLDNTFYIWDPAAADYLSWNGTTGSLGDGIVAPAQGFWVHATGAPTLTAPAAARTTGASFVGREALAGSVLEFALSDASRPLLRASAHVTFQEGAADGRDQFDGYELSPLAATARGLFTTRLSDGLPLDIQALAPTSGRVEIPVGVTAVTDGAPADADLVLTWPRLDGYDGPAFLVDGVTKEVVDLRAATSYAFHVEASETTARPASPDASAPARPVGQAARFTLVLGQRPVAGEATAERLETTLGAVAPNPFRGQTEVRYTLAEAGAVQITVHDLLGREVARLVDGEQAAGSHVARLEARGLASGVYVVRMTAPGGFVAVRRVTVVR